MSPNKASEYAKLVQLASDLLAIEQIKQKLETSNEQFSDIQKQKTPFSLKPPAISVKHEHRDALDKKYFAQYISLANAENIRRANKANRKENAIKMLILHPINVFLHFAKHFIPLFLLTAAIFLSVFIGFKYAPFLEKDKLWGTLFWEKNFIETNKNIAFYLIICICSLCTAIGLKFWLAEADIEHRYYRVFGILFIIISAGICIYSGAKWGIIAWEDEYSLIGKILMVIPLFILMVFALLPKLLVSMIIYTAIPLLLMIGCNKLAELLSYYEWAINVDSFSVDYEETKYTAMFPNEIIKITQSKAYELDFQKAENADKKEYELLRQEQNILYEQAKEEYCKYSNEYDHQLEKLKQNIIATERQYRKTQAAILNNHCLHDDQKNIEYVCKLLYLFTHMQASTIESAVCRLEDRYFWEGIVQNFAQMFQNYHNAILKIQNDFISQMGELAFEIKSSRAEITNCLRNIDANLVSVKNDTAIATKNITKLMSNCTTALHNVEWNNRLSREYLGQMRDWKEIDVIKNRNS